jgi:TolA-binding protein
LLYRLYERGDAPAYDLCLGVVERLLEGEATARTAEQAAFLGAAIRLRKGDFPAALEGFEACRKGAKSLTIKRLCRVGMGDCYVGSGGLEKGLEHYGRAGDAPAVRMRKARCYQVLGRVPEALEASRGVLDIYTAKDVSVEARTLTAVLSATEQGLPPDAFRFFVERPHYLGVHEEHGDYILLLAAYDLALRGYEGLGVRLLEKAPLGQLEGVHCQVFLSAYDPVEGERAEFFAALSEHLRPNCKDELDSYARMKLGAELECMSGSYDLCEGAGERFKRRFRLAAGAANDIDAIRATSLYREMYVGKADVIADSLFKQGVRSELLADAVYRKGVSFLLEKANQEAKQTFLIMREHFPDTRLRPDIYFKLGTTYYITGAYDSSAAHFRFAADEGKVTLRQDALFNLGLALEEGGDLAAASEAFYELAVKFPYGDRFERALMRSAYCLEKNDLPVEASGLYRTLLEYAGRPETRAEANFWLGECLAKAGFHVEAALEFMRTGYLYPGEEAWAGTARYRAGMECESAGLKNAARLVYEENVRTFGRESTWGQASYEKLQELVGEG